MALTSKRVSYNGPLARQHNQSDRWLESRIFESEAAFLFSCLLRGKLLVTGQTATVKNSHRFKGHYMISRAK